MRSEQVTVPAPPRGGKKRTTVRRTLRVVNVTLEDAGFYMCVSHQLSQTDGSSSMDWAEVFVDIHRTGHISL